MTNNVGGLNGFFKLTERGTNVKTEIIAGFTTFMTMAYILAINPHFLSIAGLDKAQVFTATALSAVVGTLIMALFANLPFALAPGMGTNAFFAFTVVLGMGFSPQLALTAVFVEGVVFLFLTFFKVREAILNCIPINLKKAISVGIGLFITIIGLVDSKVINFVQTSFAPGQTPGFAKLILVDQASGFVNTYAVACIFGIVLASILLVKNVKGALFIAILATTILCGFLPSVTVDTAATELATKNFWFSNLGAGFEQLKYAAPITQLDITKIFVMPASPNLFDFASWNEIFSFQFFVVFFTFLFLNLFDTVGTLLGVCTKAGLLNEKGEVPNATAALFADAFGTTFGACVGTSTVATFVESAAGVAEGGRTGLTALVVAILFGFSLFFSGLFLAIPAPATAVALILVGFFMMEPVTTIDFGDFTEGIPAFLTIAMMPFTYSIAEGIVFGIVSYVILKLVTGQTKDVKPLTAFLAVLFVFKEIAPTFYGMFK